MRVRVVVLSLLASAGIWAQLTPNGSAIPRKDKPPVVFLNGYQQDCGGSSFAGTFGTADQVLQANGEVSVFFDNCSVPGRPAIEELGKAFGTLLAGLKYDDGTAVTIVDVVAHSMGGLILRSYLSGKQTGAAVFQPPVTTKVRKIVFLATPQFGSDLSALPLFGLDDQTRELATGSQFLFDLGTWNQGTDDLRGSDALALAGNGGTGSSFLGVFSRPGFDDGVVALTSASIGFVYPGRTRVVPFCHIPGGGLITFGGLCSGSAKGIANIRSASDPQAVAMVSFLNGTNEWKSVGTPAESDPFLSKNGALDVETRTADDAPIQMDSATATPASPNPPLNLSLNVKTVAYSNLVPAGPVALKTVAGTVETAGNMTLAAGAYTPVVLKTGPIVGRVYPAASVVFPLSVAPGEFVAIYGTSLAGATATAATVDYPAQLSDTQVLVNGSPAPLYFVSGGQIDAVIPDNAAGLVKLTVKNASGTNSVNVLVETAVPAIFTQNGGGTGAASALNASTGNKLVTGSNPLKAGDFVSLYLTGLGATTRRDGLDWANQQPSVTVAGQPCAVSYAGRAPGFKGLDQINCQIPSGLTADSGAQIVVFSGSRGSNVATVAVQ